jgi:hypothetical protein
MTLECPQGRLTYMVLDALCIILCGSSSHSKREKELKHDSVPMRYARSELFACTRKKNRSIALTLHEAQLLQPSKRAGYRNVRHAKTFRDINQASLSVLPYEV